MAFDRRWLEVPPGHHVDLDEVAKIQFTPAASAPLGEHTSLSTARGGDLRVGEVTFASAADGPIALLRTSEGVHLGEAHWTVALGSVRRLVAR